MRLDRGPEYFEISQQGPELTQSSGRIGGEPVRRSQRFDSPRAAAAGLRELVAAKKKDGFRETTSDDVRRKVEEYDASKDAKKILALLEWFDTLGPSLRKLVRYPNGRVVDVAEKIALYRFLAAQETFVDADRAYWAQHDAAEQPNLVLPAYDDAFDAADDAIAAAIARRRSGKPAKRAAKLSYAQARELVRPYAVEGGCGLGKNVEGTARAILAVIALREGDANAALDVLRTHHDRGVVEPLFGAAFLMTGEEKEAEACFARWSSSGNLGHLAEARGDLERAARFYLEAAESVFESEELYGKLRLKRLRDRLGPGALKRIIEASGKEKTAGKIALSRPEDFHAQFPQIADALRQKLGIKAPKRPLEEGAIAKIRLSTLRRSGGASVGLPMSAKTILRYDRNFTLFSGADPLLGPLFRSKTNPVPSANVEKLVRASVSHDDTMGYRPLARLPPSVPVWNDAADLPACITLAHPGDQNLFLYMGVPDDAGEYPLARFDDQPELWVSEASLIHYVLHGAAEVVDCAFDFGPLLTRAKKRNRKHRETFSKHAKVGAILERT